MSYVIRQLCPQIPSNNFQWDSLLCFLCCCNFEIIYLKNWHIFGIMSKKIKLLILIILFIIRGVSRKVLAGIFLVLPDAIWHFHCKICDFFRITILRMFWRTTGICVFFPVRLRYLQNMVFERFNSIFWRRKSLSTHFFLNNNNNFGTNTRHRARPRTYSKLWSA